MQKRLIDSSATGRGVTARPMSGQGWELHLWRRTINPRSVTNLQSVRQGEIPAEPRLPDIIDVNPTNDQECA